MWRVRPPVMGLTGGPALCEGGQEPQFLVAVAVLVRVVDDQDDVVDGEFVAVEAEFTDDGVVHRGRAPVQTAHVVAGPQGAERLTAQRELSDELDEPGVVRVVPDRGAQGGDEIGGRLRPVALEGLLLGVEEQGAKPVLARPQAGESASAIALEARTSNARPSTNAGI